MRSLLAVLTVTTALLAPQVANPEQSSADGGARSAPVTSPSDSRPNILLISSDDQRADEMRFLPKTRALLGKAGIRFKNALTPHPLCCPARAEILSGQFAHNNGVRTNFGPQGGFDAYDPTHSIATDLSAAGYNTAMLGKHLNAVDAEAIAKHPGWTLFNPTLNGYSDYYDFSQYNEGDVVDVEGYYTDYLNKTGVEYLSRLSDMDAPFFAWFSHFAPHSTRAKGNGEKSPPLLSPSYQERAAAGRSPRQGMALNFADKLMRKRSFNEKDVSDKQHLLRTETKVSRRKIRDLVVGRAGALASLDDSVAAYVQQLQDDGELENTYIMFISDNGYLLGEHRRVGKVLPFEENFRMPLLVRGPGVQAGSTAREVATTVDLAATFLDIAGAQAGGRTVDGVSFLPTLKGARGYDPHASGVLTQGGAVRSETGVKGWYYRGIRTDRYTYSRYFDGHRELFDREKDPHEINSVVDSRDYKRVVRKLDRRVRTLKKCSGPSCYQDFGALPEPR